MPEALPESISRSTRQAPESGALLDLLRSETKEDHHRLEDGLNLLRPDLALTTYAQILGRFYGFYRPWEANVASLAAELLPDFHLRQKKVSCLLADLSYLGVDASTLPLCLAVPYPDNIFSALGGLYVTEGATLGGQIISRHLRTTFSFPEGQGDAFFQSYGSNVGSRWRSFRDRLTAHSSPSTDNEIIDAAKLMFRTLDQWFSEAK